MILRPTSPAHGGAVVAREDGKVWLVNYALPGEVVEAEPRGKQGGVAVARTTRVVEPSPQRVLPKCPHFGECGGCQYQHLEYSAQLRLKHKQVCDLFQRIGGLAERNIAVSHRLMHEHPRQQRIVTAFQ